MPLSRRLMRFRVHALPTLRGITISILPERAGNSDTCALGALMSLRPIVLDMVLPILRKDPACDWEKEKRVCIEVNSTWLII